MSQTLGEHESEFNLLIKRFLKVNYFRHQEDFYAFASLSLNPEELRLSVKKSHNIDWDPKAVDDTTARQVLFVGIYDG